MHELTKTPEKVMLVGLRSSRLTDVQWERTWSELRGLVETAGGLVAGELVQNRDVVDPSTVLGSGKLVELSAACKELGIDTAAFQIELSPAQVRTLEAALPCRVVDRTQVILDIFAARAQSHEGKLQVELAQLAYLLPRLTGRGIALSRLGGGIGTRGPGETKLETDRRHIRGRMNELRYQIKQITKVRETQRRSRKRTGIKRIALVGYTNAGKTSLLRALLELTGGHAQEISGRNRLFDTLDPTSRRVQIGVGQEVIFTDTVGFIEELPHTLVDAFRSTLEEALDADLLLHVVDASHSAAYAQMETVYRVLEEIGSAHIPMITVYNKSDLCPKTLLLTDPKSSASVRVSTRTGKGLQELERQIQQTLTQEYVTLQLQIPYQMGELVSQLYQEGFVITREDAQEGMNFLVKVPPQWVSRFEPYQIGIAAD